MPHCARAAPGIPHHDPAVDSRGGHDARGAHRADEHPAAALHPPPRLDVPRVLQPLEQDGPHAGHPSSVSGAGVPRRHRVHQVCGRQAAAQEGLVRGGLPGRTPRAPVLHRRPHLIGKRFFVAQLPPDVPDSVDHGRGHREVGCLVENASLRARELQCRDKLHAPAASPASRRPPPPSGDHIRGAACRVAPLGLAPARHVGYEEADLVGWLEVLPQGAGELEEHSGARRIVVGGRQDGSGAGRLWLGPAHTHPRVGRLVWRPRGWG
mmetsp:Transcript_40800/g.130235  ORF Transcript_40800/g.130235 Transcript_40800/m.130235 type:complete len:266 (-) Transcript_40800:128-925(-)